MPLEHAGEQLQAWLGPHLIAAPKETQTSPTKCRTRTVHVVFENLLPQLALDSFGKNGTGANTERACSLCSEEVASGSS